MRRTPFSPVSVLIGLIVLLAATTILAVAIGPEPIPFRRVVRLLVTGLTEGFPEGRPDGPTSIVLLVRLPRVIVGLLVGGGLAVCGAVMQAMFRNPMADPGILGVTGGAALGAVSAIAAGWAAQWILAIPLLAFAGALACAFLVYAVATRGGRTPVATLLLSGIAVGTVTVSLTSLILSFSLANYEIGRQIVLWLMGGLDARTWLHVRLAAPVILGGTAILISHARNLNVMLTGEESAWSLGIDVPRIRRNLIVVTCAVTAMAVGVSGSIAFVGLVVPHILRLGMGPDHRGLLPASFLTGGLFLTTADIACRTWIAPEEIRVGVITSLLGGPFFLWLLVRHRKGVQEL